MERIEKIKEMLITSPDDSFLEHALALEYIKTGDDNTAKLLFEKLLEREPGYVGSYYHLGKVAERSGDYTFAILTYNAGISEALKIGDHHSLNELRAALEEITEE